MDDFYNEEIRNEYISARQEESYSLYKDNKFFRKSRAIIIKDDKVILIEYRKQKKVRYVIPGGGVEERENPKQTAIREAIEEVNMVVDPFKYISKEYYTVQMKHENEDYLSRRVTYYYLCRFLRYSSNTHMGLPGEFNAETNVVALSLDEIKKLKHYTVNNMSKKTFLKLIQLLEEEINGNKEQKNAEPSKKL